MVTNGTLDQINQDFQNVKELVGFLTVNISDIAGYAHVRNRFK